MKNINVLVTAGGSPGAPGIIKSLRLNGERKIRIICTDMNEDSAGLYLADAGYVVPPGKADSFIPIMMEIAKRENIDVIMPLSTPELMPFSKNKENFEKNGIKITVSDPLPLSIANDRIELYKFLHEKKIPHPKFKLVNSFEDFEEAVYDLGYPIKPVCFKPRIGNGGRGFRVLKEDINKLDLLLHHKPDSTMLKFKDAEEILKEVEHFPELIVMEYLPGREYSIDALVKKGNPIAIVPRLRCEVRLGVSYIARIENNEEVKEIVSRTLSALGLDYNVNIQVKYGDKGPKIIEVNPRMSGTIVFCTAAGVNLPYLAVKMVLGEELPEIKPIYNMKMIRHWEEVFLNQEGHFQLKI